MTWCAPAFAQQRHVAMTLLAEGDPAPGGQVTLAFRALPDAGWHAYWKNPGDAGLETRLTWTLPRGVRAGPIAYPVPGRLIVAGLMNYVYEAPFALLTDLSVPAGAKAGDRLPVSVKVDYLVCTTTICVPETQTLSTVVTVGAGSVAPARRAQFDAWRRLIPRPLGATARYQVSDGRFRLAIPFPADAPARDVYFYPLAGGAIDDAAPQKVAREGDRITVETTPTAGLAKGTVDGVLSTGDGRGFVVSARPGAIAATTPGWQAAALAFAGAVLGGLLLNLMPCVFPILSLKALSLARAGEGKATARREGLAYAAGVILVCVALGGVLLALRAGGSAAGWAFQLQDPRVVGVLLLLSTGIALNFTGLFELPTPRFAGRGGVSGAFMTGALAAFVATPCSGPFMGAALGAALVLPTAAALLVFAGLGLGIALPFLAIGFFPALRRRLPRPGVWMERLRHILSVPMFLTALALAWVLGRQAGVDGMTIGLGALLILSIGLWIFGRRQRAGRPRALWYAGLSIVVALAAVAAIRPATGARPVQAAGAEPFGETRLAALRAQGRPVFAYFTADWCLTCKVNEKVAIETRGVADAFARGKVAVLVGDWTDGDPELGRFIARHNRAGVPLYLWYAKGASEPRVLPQVLTPGILEALPNG